MSGQSPRNPTRYVLDASVILRLLELEVDPSSQHRLLAPTLVRSQVLGALYQSVRTGAIGEAEGRKRLAAFSTMKIRYLGDKVLRSEAWKIAEHFDWDTTENAEYVALTRLQADALVTLDENLEAEVASLIDTASINVLL